MSRENIEKKPLKSPFQLTFYKQLVEESNPNMMRRLMNKQTWKRALTFGFLASILYLVVHFSTSDETVASDNETFFVIEKVDAPKWKWGHDSSGSIKYYHSSTEMAYNEAASFCADNNAYLAEIATIDDQLFYRNLLTKGDANATMPSYWLGHVHDQSERVWRRKSTRQVIKWKGWRDYNGDEKRPFMTDEPFPDDDESSTLQRAFFCVQRKPESAFRNVLAGLPRHHVEVNATFELQEYNATCRR